MKLATAALVTAFACAPAFAQDPTKPPEPAPAPGDATKTAPAKKERKVDPAATKALERYVTLVHIPATDGMKSLAGKGTLEQMGTEIEINPKWTPEAGFDADVAVPEEIADMIAAQGLPKDQIPGFIKQQVIGFGGVNTPFEAPGRNWQHFDVAFKQQGDDQVVELTPFDDEADAESRTYTFGKDGLLKSTSKMSKVDPDNPMSQQLAGQPIEATFTFEKKGERSVVTGRSLSIMGSQVDTEFSYYELPGGAFLLKEVTIMAPGQESVVRFHDYTVDGKLAESTKADAAKPATPSKAPETPGEKPAEPAPAPKEPVK